MAATGATGLVRTSVDLEPGDRFEVRATRLPDGSVQISLPPEISDPAAAAEVVESDDGSRLSIVQLKDRQVITVPTRLGEKLLAPDVESVWLELVAAHRYRLTTARGGENHASPAHKSGNGAIEIRVAGSDMLAVDPADIELLRRPTAHVSPAQFEIGIRAARLATHHGFDQLISLPMVREMELLEHQTRTALTVLRRLRGRALLCDEVGLGKTVEAGLILSELLMRGLARSVLILTPPSLMAQWQAEMRRKFAVELTSHDDPAFRDAGPSAWELHDRFIVSIHTAKREPHRSAILKRKWDLVIVDEAHHLRNRATESWKFASQIEKQFVLLLTATPVQNNLEELFNLVTLLEPGLLSTRKDFSRRFIAKNDKMTPKNVDELHTLLSEVMVRNRRNSVGLQFTGRFARTESVELTPPERSLYDNVA